MRFTKSVIVLFSTLLGAFVLTLLFPRSVIENNDQKHNSENYPFYISGMTSQVFDNEIQALALYLKADEFKVIPRRFELFSIKALNEALLSKIQVDVYLPRKKESISTALHQKGGVIETSGVFSPLYDMLSGESNAAGIVTRFRIIDGVEICIYNLKTLEVRLKAKSGEFKKGGRMLFSDAKLEHIPTQRIVKTDEMYFYEAEEKFVVEGLYDAFSPKGEAKGKGLVVDFNFNLQPI